MQFAELRDATDDQARAFREKEEQLQGHINTLNRTLANTQTQLAASTIKLQAPVKSLKISEMLELATKGPSPAEEDSHQRNVWKELFGEAAKTKQGSPGK